MKHTTMGMILAIMALASVNTIGQEVRKIDVSRLGPQVGTTVPDFNLADQHGKRQTLQSVMGPKGAMIPVGRLVSVLQDAASRASRAV